MTLQTNSEQCDQGMCIFDGDSYTIILLCYYTVILLRDIASYLLSIVLFCTLKALLDHNTLGAFYIRLHKVDFFFIMPYFIGCFMTQTTIYGNGIIYVRQHITGLIPYQMILHWACSMSDNTSLGLVHIR